MTKELPFGFGTYDMKGETCRSAVEYAIEVGYRHIDTAEMYGNERAVGEAIESAPTDRDDLFVATKVQSRNLAYTDVIEHAEASRNKLGIETIDLLYVHWPIRTYDPAETLPALDELHDRGTIRHIGVSNFTPELLEEAISQLEAPIFAHQVECHPFLPQAELRRIAREYDHHLVAYSPIAKSSVSDAPVLADIAAKYDATPAQLSLAWLVAKDVVPIPKSKSEARIRENWESQQIELDTATIERIDRLEDRKRLVDFPSAPWNAR